MFDLGWSELLLIGVVALIVVGPKDLPGMFRTVGQLIGKAKRMAREFSQAMHDAADESGVSDIQRSIEKATRPVSSAMDQFKKTGTGFAQQTMSGGKPGADTKADRPEGADPAPVATDSAAKSPDDGTPAT